MERKHNSKEQLGMEQRAIAVYRTRTRELQEFNVPVNDRTTIIDALEYIRLNEDPDLMFRQSCHHGACGTCGMAVNGTFVLACTARVTEFADEGPVRVEPLPTMEQIGDLAYDPSDFMREFPDGLTYHRQSEVNPDAETPDGVEQYTRLESCIECGLCVTACPVEESWMGPAALAAIHRQIEKQPEREEELLDLAADPRGAAICTRDFACTRSCPTGVDPGRHIFMLKKKLKKRAKAQQQG